MTLYFPLFKACFLASSIFGCLRHLSCTTCRVCWAQGEHQLITSILDDCNFCFIINSVPFFPHYNFTINKCAQIFFQGELWAYVWLQCELTLDFGCVALGGFGMICTQDYYGTREVWHRLDLTEAQKTIEKRKSVRNKYENNLRKQGK